MAEVRKIECPSCGSNSTYKLFDGNYKCNYCKGNFMVTDAVGIGNRIINRTTITPVVSVNPASATKRVVLIIAIAVLMFAIGIGVFVAKMAAPADENGKALSSGNAVQADINLTTAFIGSRGPAIWVISKEHQELHRMLVADPQKSVLMADLIFDEISGNRFFPFGDMVYTINNDKKPVGYNMYTGILELNAESLAGQFPALKAGILKAEYTSSSNTFKLITTAGDVFNYDPALQTLSSKEEEKHNKKAKELPVTTDLYLSDGLKHQLYKLTKQGDGFPIVFNGYVQESLITEATGSKKNNIEDVFGSKRIEKVSEKAYFRAQPLVKGEDQSLVLLYKTDLSDKGTIVLESITAEGKTNWTLSDPLFSGIGKAFASEDLGCEYTHSNDMLILEIPSEGITFIGIDLKTGKILWKFNATTYLHERA